jgi:hypothetical protein
MKSLNLVSEGKPSKEEKAMIIPRSRQQMLMLILRVIVHLLISCSVHLAIHYLLMLKGFTVSISITIVLEVVIELSFLAIRTILIQVWQMIKRY